MIIDKKNAGYSFKIKKKNNILNIRIGLLSFELDCLCSYINRIAKTKDKVTYYNIDNFMQNKFNKLPKDKRLKIINKIKKLKEGE